MLGVTFNIIFLGYIVWAFIITDDVSWCRNFGDVVLDFALVTLILSNRATNRATQKVMKESYEPYPPDRQNP